MNHFITLFVLITLALSQDTGTVSKADCTLKDACPSDVFLTQIMCTDPTTKEMYSPWRCVNNPKDPSVCMWSSEPGCPVVVCECDKAQQPLEKNYLCADQKTWGGPVCTPECKWDIITCDPYVVKTGYCPLPSPKDDVFCAATTYSVCTSDSDCSGTQKCCTNDCKGTSCVEPTPVVVRPGVCPAVTGDVGICGISCNDDGGCGDKQKCCPNSCKGYSCVNVFDSTTPDYCDVTECPLEKPQTFASTLCPDGINTQGPFCDPTFYPDPTATDSTKLIRKCDWSFRPCPDVTTPDIHKGTCPIFNTLVACDPNQEYKNECESDRDCILSDKCCWAGCSKVCCNAVADNTCTVAGYKNYYCLDKATAETAGATTTSDSTILPGDDCYYRCSQKSICSYDATTSSCTRDEEYKKCLDYCLNPPVDPPPPKCLYKTSCDCMNKIEDGCGWCQVKAYTTSADGTTTKPYVWGYCTEPSGTNLCSASYSSGGNEGSFCTVAPTECIDDSSVDPTIKDTSAYFSEQQYKESFSNINTGKVTEADVQKAIDTYKPEGCDFTIKRILKAEVTIDEKGKVSSIVEVYNSGGKTEKEMCDIVIKGYADSLGLPETSFKDCTFEPYSTSSTTVKRAVTSGEYLQTATVDPASTESPSGNASGTLAPIWMVLFAIFLFFRM